MSLFPTHHLKLTPEEYIFCRQIPSPFLSSHPISLLLCPCARSSLIRSQRGHERLRPVLPSAAGASPGPWLPAGLLRPLAHRTPSAPGARHSAQHSLAWVRCLHSSSPWDPALFLSFCFLLFMVLNPALRPCANAPLLAKLNAFQGRLHKSSGLVLGARPAGLDVLFSRPRSCWTTCWHELPPKRSQQDASGAACRGGARAAVL